MKNLPIIQNKIYEIRGLKVILDFDLADLYEVETRIMNQSVKRNSDRFPEDFMFQLTTKEWETMSSQIVMTSLQKRPKKARPFAFTEHGVTMPALPTGQAGCGRQVGQCIAQQKGSKNEYRHCSCLYCAAANCPVS